MNTRRQLLRGVGVASATAVAGCVGGGAETNSSPTTKTTATGTTTTGGNQTSTEEPTTDGGPQETGNRFLLSGTEVLEDFEDLSSWSVSNGNLKPDTSSSFDGSQSMRLTAQEGNEFVWATRGVDWDLSNKTLSLAINIDSPVDNLIVAVRLVAPDTNNVTTMGELVRARESQGWMRLDLATRNFEGNPDLANVTEVQLGMRAASGAIDFSVDDLRAVPRPDKGYVVLSFDDSLESHYSEAFKTMQEYDMPGNVGVITGQVGTEGSLTVDQMTEMRESGWELTSHSTRDKSLTKLSTQQLWLAINDANDWLANNGFAKGSDSFIYPHGVYNDEILEYVGKNHSLGFRYMDPMSAASGLVTDTLTVGRGNAAYDMKLNKTMVNYAEMFNNLTVFTVHDIGSDKGLSMTPDQFTELVDYIHNRNVEVVTFSQVRENLLAD